jgi:hypothetical protein
MNVLFRFPLTSQVLPELHSSATSRLIFVQYKSAIILLEVFQTPKCAVNDESWVRLITALAILPVQLSGRSLSIHVTQSQLVVAIFSSIHRVS